MTPSRIRSGIVSERVSWIRDMTRSIRTLPTNSFEEFVQDPRNPAAAESYLRRGIEALLDLGRHILAKGFAIAATEYKDIGKELFPREFSPGIRPNSSVVLRAIATAWFISTTRWTIKSSSVSAPET